MNLEQTFESLIEEAVDRVITRNFDALKSEMCTLFEERIKLLTPPTENAPSTERFLTSKEVKEMLSCAHSTLWKMKQDGRLVPLKIGRKSLYREGDVRAFLRC